MKHQKIKYHTFKTVLQFNRQMVNVYTPSTQVQQHYSLFRLGTGASIKSDRVKLVLCAQTSVTVLLNLHKYFINYYA